MADMTFTVSVNVGGQTRTYRKTATATDPVNTNAGPITVPNGASNQQISLAGVDISQCKGVFIASDQDVLVEFNSNTGTGGAINLESNIPYMWQVGDVNALVISADITAVYVTNASGADAEVYFYFLHDATP